MRHWLMDDGSVRTSDDLTELSDGREVSLSEFNFELSRARQAGVDALRKVEEEHQRLRVAKTERMRSILARLDVTEEELEVILNG